MEEKLVKIYPNSYLVEGAVTAVYELTFSFQVGGVLVHTILQCLQSGRFRLPQKGAKVKVSSSFFNTDGRSVTSIVVSDEEVEAESWLELQKTDYTKLVKVLNLTPRQYLQIARIDHQLRRHLNLPPGPLKHEDFLMKLVVEFQGDLNFDLKFLNEVQYVDKDSKKYKGLKFYTFGNHWNYVSSGRKTYLLGYITTIHGTGTRALTDYQQTVPSIITNEWNYSQGYVLIGDYTVITEIYNCKAFASLQYLVFEGSQAVKLDLPGPKREGPNLEGYTKSSCYIIRKSQFMAVAPMKRVFWLEAKMDGKKRCFLSLNASYSDIYESLEVGQTYHLYRNGPPTKTRCKEIESIDLSLPLWVLPPNSHFIKTSSAATTDASPSDLVTFEDTISLKKFVDKNSSRTKPVSTSTQFDTPGDKTHLLLFKSGATLYLNNWENLAAPHGLVPNMKVIVYNVKRQNNYYKSVAFTSFKVIKYEPEVRFESANLFRKDWGQPYYLGTQRVLPKDVVIYGRPTSFFVLGLKVEHLATSITLVVSDPMGEAKIIAKEAPGGLLLRLLLRMSVESFGRFCEMFKTGRFKYSRTSSVQDFASEGEEGKFRRLLVRLLHTLDKKNPSLEFKCRLMECEPSGKPVFYLLDCRGY